MIDQFEFDDLVLPIAIDRDIYYTRELSDRLDIYIKFLESKLTNDDLLINDVKAIVEMIKSAINVYLSGDIANAQEIIFSLLKGLCDNEYIKSDLSESLLLNSCLLKDNLKDEHVQYSNVFFRGRTSKQGRPLNKEEMYHISLNERQYISTQRFSIPGVPCIYLANSSFCCWLELNRPSDNEFWISMYKVKENISVLNLSSKVIDINNIIDNNVEGLNTSLDLISLRNSMIKIWPLVCASSFSVSESNRSFQSEYIISHLIMMNLKRLNINGVIYLSTKIKDDLSDNAVMYNLAIPAYHDENDQTYDSKYSKLYEKLYVSNPVNLGEFNKLNDTVKKSYLNDSSNGNLNSKIQFAGTEVRYRETLFSEFDEYLMKLHY